MLLRDAKWLYDWGQQWTLDDKRKITAPGTPVYVLGTYPFDRPAAWLDLHAPPISLPDGDDSQLRLNPPGILRYA